MPRRNSPEKRTIPADPRYNSVKLAFFINSLMVGGKKSTARRVVYGALELIQERSGKEPMDVFSEAVANATPHVEVKPRRVGGATYQVPVEVRSHRQHALAIRWLLTAARKRSGRSMAEKLANELMDAATGQGGAVKQKDDTHRMADANKAFAHYRF